MPNTAKPVDKMTPARHVIEKIWLVLALSPLPMTWEAVIIAPDERTALKTPVIEKKGFAIPNAAIDSAPRKRPVNIPSIIAAIISAKSAIIIATSAARKMRFNI